MGRYDNSAASAERLKGVTDKLEAGIAELYESDRYAAYLQAMSRFHRYSYKNIILILAQYPSASRVAGFHAWKKFGRSVKKGERGIQILAPCSYTKLEQREDAESGTQEVVAVKKRRYKVEYVFDVTQTEGRELPDLVGELSGDVEQYEMICAALQAASPVPITFGSLPPGVKGQYSHVDQLITILPGMSQVQTIKTMIHEVAHSKLHALPVENGVVTGKHEKSRPTRETEAESVAYVVCQRLGIDTSDQSFGYVAEWTRDKEMTALKASLGCIRDAAAEIIGSIEQSCPELAPPEPEPVQETKPRSKKTRRGRSNPVR